MSAMKVSTFNGCKVYNLSTGAALPSWMTENKKRGLAKSDEYRKRIELIQEFNMPIASTKVKFCPDGEHIIAVGTYPPIVKCFTTSDLSEKFRRGLNSDVVTFETLSDDFGKLLFLHVDRYLSFHAPYGAHYQLRIPKQGRDMVYSADTCDAIVCGEGNELYRMNLESGTFRQPLGLSFDGCNKLASNPGYPLLAAGGETATIDFFDTRARDCVASILASSTAGCEISALKFDTQGLTLGVGTTEGHCILYDVRSSKPLYTKEHQFGLPVMDVQFHEEAGMVISSDRKVVKIWDRGATGGQMGKIMTNIETPSDINSVEVVKDRRGSSGLIMIAGEQERIMNYFVPDLGPAPRWCSHLEGLTEELEESNESTVYEDFKFVTRAEVEEIGAGALIGTATLRAYMHGFFMDMKLYSKLRAASKPFEYDEYRKAKIKEKIDAKRESRITVRKRLPKVNTALAEKLGRRADKDAKDARDAAKARREGGEDGDGSEGEGEGGDAVPASSSTHGVDNRFAALFQRPEFEQDRESHEYKLRNPTSSSVDTARGHTSRGDDEDLYGNNNNNNNNNNDDDEYGRADGNGMFTKVYEDEDEDEDGGMDYSDGGDESDGSLDAVRYEEEDAADKVKARKAAKKAGKKSIDDDDEGEGLFARVSRKMKEARKSRDTERKQTGVNNGKGKGKGDKGSGSSMYELGAGENEVRAAFGHSASEKDTRRRERGIRTESLAERAASAASESARSQTTVRTIRGSEGVVREMSFVPKAGKKGKNGKGVAKIKDGIVQEGGGDKADRKKRGRSKDAERSTFMGGDDGGGSAGKKKGAKSSWK